MIVKFFKKHGKGKASSCKACVDYLLNKPDDTAQILQGDPRLSQSIADSLDFNNTYTAGCLSFEEKDLPESQKREIMARFEKAMFAGLEPEQYNIAWVQHTDKGRLELNFVIPNVELTTGKRLQPYYDRADRPLAENFKQVINHEYNLSDPNDPTKQKSLIDRKDLPTDKKQALQAITDGLTALANAGHINDRKDVINALERAGFEIARITPKNLSIKTDGQNLRLKGAFYEQDFRFSNDL
ncbi:relaxase/mobilization nuclease domain-containing protein, partial [Actinobacillus pleuropneumoniae]